jgi:hypothetical protein
MKYRSEARILLTAGADHCWPGFFLPPIKGAGKRCRILLMRPGFGKLCAASDLAVYGKHRLGIDPSENRRAKLRPFKKKRNQINNTASETDGNTAQNPEAVNARRAFQDEPWPGLVRASAVKKNGFPRN